MHFDKNSRAFYAECRTGDNDGYQLQVVVLIADSKKEAVEAFNTIITAENSIRKKLKCVISEDTLNNLSEGIKEICNTVCYRFPDNVFTSDNKDGFGCYGRFYRYTPSLLMLIISKVHNLQSVKTEQEKQKTRKKIESLFE